MLRWGRCVLIGARGPGRGRPPAREACQERTLDVRFSPQAGQASNWCWAASGQMIMELLGEEPEKACQCRQAEEVLGVKGCCVDGRLLPARRGRSLPLRRAALARLRGAAGALRFDYRTTCDGLTFRQDDEACDARPLGWRELTAEICAGRPVIASLRSRGSARGHTMVVKGFSTRPQRRVLVVDPRRLCPAGRRLRGGAGRRLLAHLRGVRGGLGRPRPLGGFLRDPEAAVGKSGSRVRLYASTTNPVHVGGPHGARHPCRRRCVRLPTAAPPLRAVPSRWPAPVLALAEPEEGPEAGGEPARLPRGLRSRALRGHAEALRADEAAAAGRPARAPPGRDRRGQGADRPHPPRVVAAGGGPLRGRQLRGHPGRPPGVRDVRHRPRAWPAG